MLCKKKISLKRLMLFRLLFLNIYSILCADATFYFRRLLFVDCFLLESVERVVVLIVFLDDRFHGLGFSPLLWAEGLNN
jgi:hypothetical protein